MRTLLALFFAIPLLLGAPALVDAAGKSKDKAKGGPVPTKSHGKKSQSGNTSTDQLLTTIISATERALIGDYVTKAKASTQGLPPGLAKRGLPDDLRRQLPVQKGQDYRVVGNDIVLIETATNLILDVMQGVLR